ncbi:hypothetical protein SAMN04515648_2900 [Phyllobacterium sp. CL33Tsu]|uniref:hypothetical protein n=1 Tax=Phyllobacterium sp. CL33Tsu TaxID=1798191 RepID=UPI0008E2B7C5|nr:hypothetical protein [Phyllobacterium sp. CL33Tsu]SFJ15243.1 hypothetical protein SAMN04515648_2900 [Phyllobacterium sp. CL33Tsu]
MKAEPLVFDGTAFNSVSVVDTLVSARGTGRRWSTQKPLAFWRVFAEMDLSSSFNVEMFAGRYGDPTGALPGQSYLPSWRKVQELLQVPATAWDPVDDRGISHVTVDTTRITLSKSFGISHRAEGELTIWDVNPVIDLKTYNTFHRARSLDAFMLFSAYRQLRDRTPMRRCVECGHWFDASHARARFCSNACNIKASLRRKGEI